MRVFPATATGRKLKVLLPLSSAGHQREVESQSSQAMTKATLWLLVELGAPCGAHVSAIRGELRGSVQSGRCRTGSVTWTKVRVGDEVTGGH